MATAISGTVFLDNDDRIEVRQLDTPRKVYDTIHLGYRVSIMTDRTGLERLRDRINDHLDATEASPRD